MFKNIFLEIDVDGLRYFSSFDVIIYIDADGARFSLIIQGIYVVVVNLTQMGHMICYNSKSACPSSKGGVQMSHMI